MFYPSLVDDFDTNYIIDRNLQTSLQIVDGDPEVRTLLLASQFSSNDKLISSHYLCLPLNVLQSVHFKFTSQPKFTSPGFPLIERPLQGYNTWRTAELRLL